MKKIENVEDQDKLLIQNSIKYLNSLTRIKELNVPTLKSLYRTKCRLMELRSHSYLPQKKANYRCQRCFMNFSEGPTKFEIVPGRLSSFAKRVLRKVKNKRFMTKFQKIYCRKLRNKFPNGFKSQNKMLITCHFCKKKSEIWMTKPNKSPLLVKNVITSAKKKKKSKKDKFCGLHKNAVSQLTSKKKRFNATLTEIKTDTNQSTNELTTKNNNNLNISVSLTNTRLFETADFIPLESQVRKKSKIKLSKNNYKNGNKAQLVNISKTKEKLQKKNLRNLGTILKKASENRNRKSSSLKTFLAGL